MQIVEITGGLGNQMFQYAFGKHIKHLYPHENVKYDISYYGDRRAIRNYELANLGVKLEVATKAEIRKIRGFYQYDNKYLIEVTKRLPGKDSVLYLQEDLDKGYQPEIIQPDRGYYSGYWQCEKYFADIRDEIMADFRVDDNKITREYREFYEKLETGNTVSVHIRLGDYLNAENYAVYGNICTSDYYRRAFDYINERIPDAKYYIFTNDESKAAEIVPSNMDFEFVHFENEVDFLDMIAMSKCKHNIIANSTFSWWGAWLNQNEQKMVLCPTRWFNNHDVADQLCEEWIKI